MSESAKEETYVVVAGKHIGPGPTGQRKVFRKGDKITTTRNLAKMFQGKFAVVATDESAESEEPKKEEPKKTAPKK